MKIIFLCHTISHLWPKIAIVWAIFGHFWHVFSDFLLSVTQLCSLWEPFQPEHSWPMWGQGFKPFLGHWAIHLWLGGLKIGDLWLKNSQNDRVPYWAKKPTWKLDNGPIIIHLHHAGQDGLFSSTQWYCASNHSFTQTSWTTMACLINMNWSIWNPKETRYYNCVLSI